jgi:histidyl-tRNA synthetase
MNWLLLEYLRLEYDQAMAMMRLIDRLSKMSEKEFLKAAEALLSPAQRETDLLQRLVAILRVKQLEQLPLVTQQHPAVSELRDLMHLLATGGVTNAMFDPTLMRGFDYYTNIVFEVFDTHPKNNRSMFGGGRYDALIAEFGVEPLPTVGFGMGDVTLQDFLTTHKLLPDLEPETDARVILVGDIYDKAQKVLTSLRKEGLRLAVDPTNRKMDTQIRSANKAGLTFVIFIGEKELASSRFKLKNLVSGEEKELSLERLVSTLAARHQPAEDL